MKRILTLLFILLLSNNILLAQKLNISEEILVNGNFAETSVLYSDETGIYCKGSEVVQMKILSTTFKTNATLLKYDHSFNKIYEVDFSKLSDNKDFEDFFFINNKLYLVVNSVNPKSKEVSVEFIEIDKQNGLQKGEFKQILTLDNTSNLTLNKDFVFNIKLNADSSKFIIAQANFLKKKSIVNLYFLNVDFTLFKKYSGIDYNIEDDNFKIHSIELLPNNNFILACAESKWRKQEKEIVQFDISLYNSDGKLIKKINEMNESEFMVQTKFFLSNNNLYQLAIYSESSENREHISSIGLIKRDLSTGDILENVNSKFSQFNLDDLSNNKKRSGLYPNFIKIGKILTLKDNSIITVCSLTSQFDLKDNSSSSSSFRDYGYLVCKFNAKHTLNWASSFKQYNAESLSTHYEYRDRDRYSLAIDDFLSKRYFFPYNLGYNVLLTDDNLKIIFNDDKENEEILDFKHSFNKKTFWDDLNLHIASINVKNGFINKTFFEKENKSNTTMPGWGYVNGTTMYFLDRNFKQRFLSKTKIKLCELKF